VITLNNRVCSIYAIIVLMSGLMLSIFVLLLHIIYISQYKKVSLTLLMKLPTYVDKRLCFHSCSRQHPTFLLILHLQVQEWRHLCPTGARKPLSRCAGPYHANLPTRWTPVPVLPALHHGTKRTGLLRIRWHPTAQWLLRHGARWLWCRWCLP
jgi:hypothetical protein